MDDPLSVIVYGLSITLIATAAAMGLAGQLPAHARQLQGSETYRHVTTAPVMISRAETRKRIEANGRTWAEFMADTTDRPSYDEAFVTAWMR